MAEQTATSEPCRSCADCAHLESGQFVSFQELYRICAGKAPQPPGAGGHLFFCGRGRWKAVIKASSFYTKPREYRQKAADCPDFCPAGASGSESAPVAAPR